MDKGFATWIRDAVLAEIRTWRLHREGKAPVSSHRDWVVKSIGWMEPDTEEWVLLSLKGEDQSLKRGV